MKRFAKIAIFAIVAVLALSVAVSASTLAVQSGQWGASTQGEVDGFVSYTDAACPVYCAGVTAAVTEWPETFVVDLYVSDVYALNTADAEMICFELNNSDISKSVAWDLTTYAFTTGWNELTLNLADAFKTTLTPSELVFTRFFAYSTAELTIAVGDIEFMIDAAATEETTAEETTAEETTAEETTAEETTAEETTATEGVYGKLAIADAAPAQTSAADIVAVAAAFGPYDLTNYKDNGGVHLSVYVSNPAAVGNGQFELSSSGAPDAQEINWKFNGVNVSLAEGWNDLYLSFDELAEVEDWESRFGGMYWDAVNYCRIYFNCTEECTIEVKDVYIYSTVAVETEETTAEETTAEETTAEETTAEETTAEKTEETTAEKQEEAAQTSDAITVAVVVALVALAAASVVVFKKNRAL